MLIHFGYTSYPESPLGCLRQFPTIGHCGGPPSFVLLTPVTNLIVLLCSAAIKLDTCRFSNAIFFPTIRLSFEPGAPSLTFNDLVVDNFLTPSAISLSWHSLLLRSLAFSLPLWFLLGLLPLIMRHFNRMVNKRWFSIVSFRACR